MGEFYSEPDEPLKARRFIEYKTRFIEPFFPKDKAIRIVDLACGYGLFLDTCRKLGYINYEGVEMSNTAVRYATQTLDLKNITCNDLSDYLKTKNDESYDVITAFNIVEHIKKDKIQSLLDLINKKLKTDGVVIIEVPNADSPLGIHTFFSDLTHEFAFSRKLAVRLLTLAGFVSIKVRYQPGQKNPFVKLAQRILAKVVGLDYRAMFSGNIILIGYKK